MNCKVTFTVNGEEISLDLETDLDSPLTDQDIIKVLSDNPDQRQALCDMIHSKLYNQSEIRSVTVNDLIGKSEDERKRKKGLLGNCGIGYLTEQFQDIEFPEGVEANVLLVDNLKVGNQSIYGRVINSNGKELFIVTGQTDKNGKARDIAKLADFLRVRQQLETQSFHFAEDSFYYKNLQKILTERNKKKDKIDNLFDLMLDFIYNKDNYQSMYITNENGERESAYNILQKINNTIMQYSGRVEYSDGFVNTINQQVKHLDNNNKFLSLDSLYGAVKAFAPDILEILEITSKTKFHEFFSKPSSETEAKLREAFGDIVEGQGYATLLSVLFSAEPEFSMYFDSSSSKGVTLKSAPRTIQAKYGIEYETIQSFDIIENDYKGYKIYAFFENGTRKFIPSRTYLTEDTVTKTYNSEAEARSYIDSAAEKQDIKKHSFMDFKFRGRAVVDGRAIYEDELSSFTVYSQQALTQGSIIESLDIPLVKSDRIFNGEDILFKEDRQNFSSFKRIVENWNISDGLKANIFSSINNAEKIATFIYKVNELLKEKRDNEQVISDVVSQIENAPRRAYYIASKTWIPGKKQFAYQVIPTNPVQIEEYKKSKRTPIISLMSAINNVLSDKFGVTVSMQTSEEITRNFPDVDANTAKAFIRDGQIYINTTIAQSTDLLHEYTHLILGVLKSDPKLRGNYEQLMDIVARTKEGKDMIRRLRSRYETASEMDLMEEAFAKLFGNHIMGKLNPELKQVFQGQERFLRDATKIVFNNEIADLQSFYGKSLETVFTRFSSDVAALLSQPGLDFGSTKTARMYSNWISKQVQKFRETEGKEGINEQCYG